MRNFLLIPHLKILNANAMSSPYTIGFPAITAWLGATHALQRNLKKQKIFENLQLTSVAISCHDFDLQTYKGYGDYVYSIKATANPLNEKGERPPFIEEARCHLDVSLLIEFKGVNPIDVKESGELINQQLQKMKFAGGDVLSVQKIEVHHVNEDDEKEVRTILRKLMLGNVLIERRDLMIKSIREGKDALDAVLDHLKIIHLCSKDDDNNVSWISKKKEPGWLVPIAVGFQGISELGFAKNQRDSETLHRFAESVVTLGEFVMPYKIKQLDYMLWQYVNPENDLYLCQTLQQFKEKYD